MEHKYFKYFMSDDPDEVISEKGIKNRKIINPMFNVMLKLLNPYKLKIESKAELPNDQPTIFVASHGFRDDILNSLLTINDNVYVLFGVLDQFFKTIDGIKLFLCGIILVDREDKISRAAVKPKAVKLIKLGGNFMDFFEATWNLSDNLLVAKPHVGVYDIAKDSNVEVATLTTHVEPKRFRSRCYSILGERFDITKMTSEKAYDTIRLMTKSLEKINDLLIYNDDTSIATKKAALDLLKIINDDMNSEKNPSLEKLIVLIDFVSEKAAKMRKVIEAEFEKNEETDEISKSIMKRNIDLLRLVMYAKKIVAVNELRDIIASQKYELMQKYSNYSNIPRSKLEKKEPLKVQWEKYKLKLVKQVKYFDFNKEQSYLYKEPTEYNDTEVFSNLDNITVTKKNAFVLAKTRNNNQ